VLGNLERIRTWDSRGETTIIFYMQEGKIRFWWRNYERGLTLSNGKKDQAFGVKGSMAKRQEHKVMMIFVAVGVDNIHCDERN